MSEKVNENDINSEGSGLIFGRNPVLELLKSGKNIDKIYIQSGVREGSATKIVAQARNLAIPVVEVSRKKLDELAGGTSHQGVAAMTAAIIYATVEDILEVAKSRGQKPFIVICDSINDPHNLGAVIRTAEAAGVHGVIIPKREALVSHLQC